MFSAFSRACGAGVVTAGFLLLAGGTAAAHVTVDSPGAAQGQSAVVTVRVPNESDTASTTGVSVTLPTPLFAMTEPLAGWTARVDRNDRSQITAVTWTADPGNPGIRPGQFQRFALALGPLPQQETVLFPSQQTYSDGKVVRWDQTPETGKLQPNPAPSLTLAQSSGAGHSHGGDDHAQMGADTEAASGAEDHSATDDTSRWIAGVALALGVLAVALGVGNVLRGRRS